MMPDGEKQILKILRATSEIFEEDVVPGEFLSDGKFYIKVRAKNGFIHLQEVQLSGRKVMNTVDFLRGSRMIFPETRAI